MFPKKPTCLAVVVVTLGMVVLPVNAQEFSWSPVDADGPFGFGAGTNETGDPTEIILLEGLPYRVEFEIRLNGWG